MPEVQSSGRRESAFLTVAGLNAFYERSHVLHDVSFEIPAGRSLGLLGRNGMGKSTLIKSCLGLGPAVRGALALDGVKALGLRPELIARKGVAYVPEGRGIFASLSVRENLIMAARGGYWTLDRVFELFPRLAERARNAGNMLSGGEQQMLAIGRALMTNPRLLVIDEVSEGLAPLIVREIWRTVALIRQSGVSCWLVDRNYRGVLENTDDCIFLEKGRVVWSGPSTQALADRHILERYLGV